MKCASKRAWCSRNKHSGESIGFTDLGDINNHIANLEKVLMVNLTGDQLYNIFWDADKRLERYVGGQVIYYNIAISLIIIIMWTQDGHQSTCYHL